MNLNQITIPSLDVAKATAFYKNLGLHLIVDALPRYVRFECPNGDATFSIHKVENLAEGHGITIYFEEENLDDYVAELQKKGIVFNQLPEDKSWLWREAHLYDLDGNHIIIYHAGKNRKNPPWRIH
ncbi:VOC family protein [Tamlana sp. 2201CG12-4]|uniref:VOC family protein n=1 Tax=Tamlana sp. 2201CG12-4 TaxID=3112582 RepID=UPI002DBF2CC3|nr:VOC family protein [Tamlana sp. 2201CG12-4]MEC3907551.1 VOC family protein [Tamlana sp. 2201CG12-4]